MMTLRTIQKLAATTALAGSLGLAALGLGAGLAAADTATSGASTGTSSESSAGLNRAKVSPLKELSDTLKPTKPAAKPSPTTSAVDAHG